MSKRRNKAARKQETRQEVKPAINREIYLICAVLILATIAVYWPAASFKFINCDDDLYVKNNAVVHNAFGPDSIPYAFTSTTGGNWMPLVWISFYLDHSRSGAAGEEVPGPYHVTNIALHIVNALLLFLVLNAMTGSRWRSGFVALLFAIHPLHVESVAWVAERKDTLSTVFWLLTMLVYVGFVRDTSWRRYALVLGTFVLGIMSKPMLVTLPIVLLLCDVWPLRRIEKGRSLASLIIEKIPMLAISGAACVVAVNIQRSAAALTDLRDFPLGIRFANAAVSSVAYIRKMVWPSDLAWQYPHPQGTLPAWEVIGSIILLAVLTAGAILAIRKKPYAAFGWFWYVITLVPVIGLVQVGHQGMADRYTYVPLIGLFVIITWGAAEFAKRLNIERALPYAGGAVAIALAMCAFHQVGFWQDSVSVCERAIAMNPRNAVAHNNLGLALLNPFPSDPATRDRAIRHLETAAKIDPTQSGSEYGIGAALQKEAIAESDPQRKQALLEEATKHLLRAINLDRQRCGAMNDPRQLATAENNLGVLLWQQGKYREALKHAEAAAYICPDNADIHQTLGFMRQKLGLDPETGR